MYIVENNKIPWNKKFKILNFYSDSCPPCHAFMPNFFAAEETFWEKFDFLVVNVANNMQLASSFWIRWTPTIIILDWDKVAFNQSGIPNGQDLKNYMISLIWWLPEKKSIIVDSNIKKKKFLWLF